jgi:hypothetical protein
MMRIIWGDLSDPRVVDLLQIHLTSARAIGTGQRSRLGLHRAAIARHQLLDDLGQ